MEAGKKVREYGGCEWAGQPAPGLMKYEGELRASDFPRVLVLTGKACGLRKKEKKRSTRESEEL